MSRPQRIEFPGAFYHVMNRGRHREPIFHKEQHYASFLDILGECVDRFGCELHAYCLMSNHYHLLISTPNANLQRAMRHLGGVYTQYYNRDMGCDGALFRGRYKAILVDHDAYLLHVGKYIHLNPLEAKMVERLDAYPWSSYPAYVGKANKPNWLSCDMTYQNLTESRQKHRAYRSYVEGMELSTDIVDFYNKKRVTPILGDDAFKKYAAGSSPSNNKEAPRYERQFCVPSLTKIVGHVAEAYGVTQQSIMKSERGRGQRNWPRSVAMYLSQRVGDYTLSELAKHFGLNHYGSVSSQVRQVKKLMMEDKRITKEINTIITRFDP